MKYCFLNAESLQEGIALVAEQLGIEVADKDAAALTVTVTEVTERVLRVSLDGAAAQIVYGGGKAVFFRGLARLAGWLARGKARERVEETPLFKTNGAMVDMSRNAVMRPDTVKTMLRSMALMGMNTYMLYTEDTYEVQGRPYFGHMRGRYTCEEIKDLDAYALALGIELIPCVQMLGHLATHLRWDTAKPYRDTEDVLLAGADTTYALLEDMLQSITSCFSSKRIHVGMDETYDLGRGKYLDKNGYRDRQEIYFEHLTRVIEMVRAHGLEPMMWSDMFFRMAGKDLPGYKDYDVRVTFTDEVVASVPKGIRQVFWDYYNADEAFYAVNLEKHEQLFGKGSLFAGGVWCWSGHCPLFSRSLRHTIPALEACRKKGTEEIFATVWHNGAECSLIMGLVGLAWYADYDYLGRYDEDSVKRCFEDACEGVSYDELMQSELPEHPDGGLLSLTRGFLYNDPLMGLVDKHIEGMDLQAYYRDVSARLRAAGGPKGVFAPAWETVLQLCRLLERKADFGVRLKAAYDKGDKATLELMAQECTVMISEIEALRRAHRAAWMAYNKPFGWEVHDIRYGGLAARFDTVRERLHDYLQGRIGQIEELEEERLRLDGQPGDQEPRFNNRFLWMKYRYFATPNTL